MNCPICGNFLDMTHLAKELDVQAEKANKRFWQRVWLALALVAVGVGGVYWKQPQQDGELYTYETTLYPRDSSVFSLTMPPTPLKGQSVPVGGRCPKGAFIVREGCWVPLREPPSNGDCSLGQFYALDPKTGKPTCWIPVMKDDRMPVASPPED